MKHNDIVENNKWRPGGFVEVQKGASHIKTVDWHTPPEIFTALNMEFDLDVASPIGGVDWIPTKNYYTEIDDGLKQDWYGTVWCNPPYGRDTYKWLKKFIEHNEGIALVFARTDTTWFHELVAKADSILFTKGRLCFYKNGKKPEKQDRAASGSLLVACGDSSVEALKNSGLGYFIDLRGTNET